MKAVLKNKRKLSFMAVSFLFVFLFVANANSASAATGSINTGVSSGIVGSPLSIRLTDLTVSNSYGIVINQVTFMNFTTSSTETTRQVYTNIAEWGSTNKMVIVLQDTTGSGNVSTKEIAITTFGVFIAEDMLIELATVLLVALLIVGIIVGIYRRLT